MATKKQTEIFNKQVEKLVLGFGGKLIRETEGGYKQWEVPTKVGILSISLHEPDKSSCYSIFSCFDDVKRAKELLGTHPRLNPHSGKFNWHVVNKNEIIDSFIEYMELFTK